MQNLSETGAWKNLVSNIIFLRKKYGIIKSEMAEILGVGVGTLNKIERGELPLRLSLKIVFNIHRYFGIEPKDIMDEQFTQNNNLSCEREVGLRSKLGGIHNTEK